MTKIVGEQKAHRQTNAERERKGRGERSKLNPKHMHNTAGRPQAQVGLHEVALRLFHVRFHMVPAEVLEGNGDVGVAQRAEVDRASAAQ